MISLLDSRSNAADGNDESCSFHFSLDGSFALLDEIEDNDDDPRKQKQVVEKREHLKTIMKDTRWIASSSPSHAAVVEEDSEHTATTEEEEESSSDPSLSHNYRDETRCVYFSIRNSTIWEVESHTAYTQEEHEQCWYTNDEKAKMAKKREKVISRMEAGKPPKRNSPYRGLEGWTIKASEAINEQIATMIDGIIDEQDRQWDAEGDDDINDENERSLSIISLTLSADCAAQARQRGIDDEQVAKMITVLDGFSSLSVDSDDDTSISSHGSYHSNGKRSHRRRRGKRREQGLDACIPPAPPRRRRSKLKTSTTGKKDNDNEDHDQEKQRRKRNIKSKDKNSVAMMVLNTTDSVAVLSNWEEEAIPKKANKPASSKKKKSRGDRKAKKDGKQRTLEKKVGDTRSTKRKKVSKLKGASSSVKTTTR